MNERLRLEQQRLTAPLKSLAHRFLYMGLVLAAFGLLLLGKADAVLMDRMRTHAVDAIAPILDVLSQPIASISAGIDSLRALSDLRAENAELRRHRDRLLQWQDAARRLDAENQSLRAMLNYQPVPTAQFVSARVIADAGGAYVHSVVLNAGSAAGVLKGQAAVTGAGLVGRVADVGARSARILLITDLNSRIPVLIEPSRTRAILAGNNTDLPRLIRLPPGAMVSPGDRVVTSGHGGAFPAWLPVGVIATTGDAGISVQPFVERNRLEYVRVVNFGLDGILRLPQRSSSEARNSGR